MPTFGPFGDNTPRKKFASPWAQQRAALARPRKKG